MTIIKRMFRAGFVGFWRTKVVSVASILVMTITLLALGSLVLANAFFQATLTEIQKRVDISVSLKPDAAESDILALKNTVSRLPTVKSVTYNSRQQELNDFIELHKDNTLIVQSLEEVGNPFGARLNIIAVDPTHYESLAKFFDSDDALSASGQTIIDHVSFKKNIIDRFIRLAETGKRVGAVAALALICVSILVTINTISLAIYSAREEIGVMRLVGASNSYVQGPFIVEGMIAGLIAALLATGLLYPISLWLRNTMSILAIDINVAAYYIQNFGQILLLLVVTGVVLGGFASFLAVRDQIKV